MKGLITYFSASGVTKNTANNLANVLAYDVKEIEPGIKYTNDDLNWMNKESRSSKEMADKSSRPSIINNIDVNDYDTVLIGFPIWWYTAPTIINTFIESINLENKKIYLFATSGGSSIDKALNDLKNTYPNLNIISAKLLNGKITEQEIIDWIK